MGPKERGWTASLCRNWSHLGWFWAPKNACHHFCSRCTQARASRGKSCEFCGKNPPRNQGLSPLSNSIGAARSSEMGTGHGTKNQLRG